MEPTGRIWMNGELVRWEDANVHVLTHGLHYGTGVFDSLRAYATGGGPAILRHREHHERLRRSALLYGMELPFSVDELVDATRAVVRETGLDACYIRPIAYRGAGPLGVSPRGCPVDVAIAAWAWDAYLGDEAAREGIRAKVSSWERIGHRTLLPAAKATAHYLNSVLARMEAEEAGYDEAILLGADGLLAEGSGENIFLVAGGRLLTPPLTSGALGGVTRSIVLELAASLDVACEERPLARGDLYLADEVLLTGTAAELTPVCEVDGRRIGDGVPGPVTRRLQAAFQAAAAGRDPRFSHWLDTVAPVAA